MKKNNRFRPIQIVAVFSLLIFASCGNAKYEAADTLIVSAGDSLKLISQGGWVLVDAQKNTSYAKEHAQGAVNVERAQITGTVPVANSLADSKKIADSLGKAGLTVDSSVLIYDDNNNMDSGRLAWTLMMYGHQGEIRVVSGGLQALVAEGASLVPDATAVTPAVYVPGPFNPSYLAEKKEILDLLNNPRENTVILDVRTDEEYNAGAIPGAIHVNYLRNNFPDGTIKPVQQIRILYKENGIMPEDTIIMYCQTSIRAGETFAALYNAGYRNLKVYDGAWLEWSADTSLPVYIPEIPEEAAIKIEDAS